jgi:hypothetical protein
MAAGFDYLTMSDNDPIELPVQDLVDAVTCRQAITH